MTIPAAESLPKQGQELLDDLPYELRSLVNAERYQAWVYSKIAPFLGDRVLEVGAGIGNMSRHLQDRERLILTESDEFLIELLEEASAQWPNSEDLHVRRFDLLDDSIDQFLEEKLDTVISFNVLEHIEDDENGLRKQVEILAQGGSTSTKRVITFVPAHNWALGTMDRTFGHYRRYSAGACRDLATRVIPGARIHTRYFNLPGLIGWFLVGRVLRRELFGHGSVDLFERLCPVIRPVDNFLHDVLRLPLGQSLLFVVEWD